MCVWPKAGRRHNRSKIRSQRGKSTLLEIVLTEGRNREIRRLLARVGHKVLRLKRVAIASIRLAELAPGEFRRLRTDELAALRQAAPWRRKRARTGAARERVASDAAEAAGLCPRGKDSGDVRQGTPAMSSPLDAAFYADRCWHGTVAVRENVQIAEATYRVRFDCPEIARRIVPGQFLMLRLAGFDDPLLGRPLALYDTVFAARRRAAGHRRRLSRRWDA